MTIDKESQITHTHVCELTEEKSKIGATGCASSAMNDFNAIIEYACTYVYGELFFFVNDLESNIARKKCSYKVFKNNYFYFFFIIVEDV